MPKDRRPSRAPSPHPTGLAGGSVGLAGPLAVPLALTVALVALTALPRIHGNRSLAFLLDRRRRPARLAGAAGGSRRPGRRARLRPRPAARAALHPECCHLASTPTGAVLAAGLRLSRRCSSASSSSPTPSTCCCRGRARQQYVLGFGPFPIVFSTNLFLWFKDDWFVLPVPADRRRLPRQGVRALGARRQAGPHLQPVGVHAGALLARADRHRHDRPDLGAGDRHHLQPRAADLHRAVLDRPGGDVLLRDHAGDGDGGGDAVRAERALRRR